MNNSKHRELAKRLVLKAIENYKNKFILEEDLLSGVDRLAIIKEIDNISENIKTDDRAKLIAEKDYYKKQVKDLENRLHRIYSLDDCDEEFEI